MKQRIILVHGWWGDPNRDWFPWAKKALEEKCYEVIVPEMPDTGHPKIDVWVPYLAQVIGAPRADDILVGHSVGVQTILRYLETLDETQKVAKVISVAGWFALTLDEEEDPEVAKPWLETLIDFAKVKANAEKFVAIFSNDDPYVPMEENAKIFKEKLGAEIVIQNGQKHFNGDDLPVLLEVVK